MVIFIKQNVFLNLLASHRYTYVKNNEEIRGDLN